VIALRPLNFIELCTAWFRMDVAVVY